jgi:hypothetical protein
MDTGIIGNRIDGYTFTVRKLAAHEDTRWCCSVFDAGGRIANATCAVRADDAMRQGMEIAYHDAIKRTQERQEDAA